MAQKQNKSTESVDRFVRAVARKQGWELNTDLSFFPKIIEGLKKNYNTFGYFLCPCRDGDGDRDGDKDIICPCKYNLPDQEEYGHCYCGLFLKKGFKGKVEQIPERRPEELF